MKLRKLMKKASAFLLAAAICLSICAIPAAAAPASVPIYQGDYITDYMAESILQEIPTAGLSDLDTVRAVYDWVILHSERDDTLGIIGPDSSVSTAEPAFDLSAITAARDSIVAQYEALEASGKIVCQPDPVINQWAQDMMYYRAGTCAHFAAMLQVLLNHLGYPCITIPGEFINRDGSRVEHKWNAVEVNGRVYWLDVRMDNANYERTGKINHQYFLIDNSQTWKQSHHWDEAAYGDPVAEQNGQTPEQPNQNTQVVTAESSKHNIVLNGIPIQLPAYLINGSNYFKLRDVAYALLGTDGTFSVQWDAASQQIHLDAFADYVPVGGEGSGSLPATATAKPSQAAVWTNVVSLEPVQADVEGYLINGNNYFKLRDLADAVGFQVEWDESSRSILITTDLLLNTPVIGELMAPRADAVDCSDRASYDEVIRSWSNRLREIYGKPLLKQDESLDDAAQQFARLWAADPAAYDIAMELGFETTLAYGVNFSGIYVGKFTEIQDADDLDASLRSTGAMTEALLKDSRDRISIGVAKGPDQDTWACVIVLVGGTAPDYALDFAREMGAY